jgi:hypothetical protein
MGLVQSQATDTDTPIEVDGFFFTIEKHLESNLDRLIPIYGKLVIDISESFFGEEFTVNFSRQQSCC